MKTFLQITIVVCVITMAFAFTSIQQKDTGSIGDIKYSVLPPDKFQEEHGSGWVLMDDKIQLNGSDLFTKHGITTLPDARGVFIRGLNLTRSDGKGDEFQTENQRARLMGEYQGDGIKKHKHGFSDAWFAEVHCGGGNVLGSKSSDSDQARCEYSDNTDEGHGTLTETRPRNISAYIYVKISD